MRLVESNAAPSAFTPRGRLEVILNGNFGTVCSRFVGITTGQVVCEQLGFSVAQESACSLGELHHFIAILLAKLNVGLMVLVGVQ